MWGNQALLHHFFIHSFSHSRLLYTFTSRVTRIRLIQKIFILYWPSIMIELKLFDSLQENKNKKLVTPSCTRGSDPFVYPALNNESRGGSPLYRLSYAPEYFSIPLFLLIFFPPTSFTLGGGFFFFLIFSFRAPRRGGFVRILFGAVAVFWFRGPILQLPPHSRFSARFD